jgi:hypothetical protein
MLRRFSSADFIYEAARVPARRRGSVVTTPDNQDRADQNDEADPRSLQRKPARNYWLDHIGYFGPP